MKRIAILLAVALFSLLAAVAVAGLPSSVPDDVVVTERQEPSTTASVVSTPAPETGTSATTLTTVPPTSVTTIAPQTTAPADTDVPSTASSTAAPTTTSSTAAPTTTSTLVEPAGLRVVVVNGTSQPGLGADNAGLLNSLGYALTIPADAVDKNELTTDVLFANGFRQEAEVLATALQIDVASVAPVPEQQFTVQLVDGDLWLMLGADRVP